MYGKILKKGINLILILSLFLGVSTFIFGQDKQDEQDKQLREEILSIYKSKGEQGLRDFVKKQGDKISNEFIVDFARTGVKNRKEEWLKVCEVMVREKKDEKTLADVLLITGKYLRLISNYKMAIDYFNQAIPIYIKLNDQVGQSIVYKSKGNTYLFTGNNSKALEMYEKALQLFEKTEDLQGQGTVYLNKGHIYAKISKDSKAFEMYDKALSFFEKTRSFIGQGNVHLKKGVIYSRIGEGSKAIEMYNKALPLFEKLKFSSGQANVYLKMGDIYSFSGNNSKAFEMFEKAMSLFKKARSLVGQGNTYLRKGNVLFIIGKHSISLEMYDKALLFFKKVGQHIGQGNVYLSKGDVYFSLGSISKTLAMYDNALPFFEKVGQVIGKGNVYWRKGNVYFFTGDYSRAFEMYNKALPFFEKARHPIGLGNLYAGKGALFFQIGDNSKAFEMYDKALFFFEKAGSSLGQANVFLREGNIYKSIGYHSKALDIYDKALLSFEKAGVLTGQGNIYQSKGEIYFSLGYNSRVQEMYDKALTFFEKAGQLTGQGNVYRSRGNVYLRTGKISKALEMYEKALTLYKKEENIESESYTLYGKAKVLEKLGKNDEALELFEKVIANLEKVRTQTSFSDMKRTFLEKVYYQYEETVLFLLENKHYEKGFKYAEGMRARVFLDQLAEGLMKLDKGLAPDLKQKRDKLVTKLSFLSKEMHKVSGKNDEGTLLELKEQYRKSENEFDELLIKIRLNNPLYASERYPQPISVQDLQKEIFKKDELLLRYFISTNKIHVFLIFKEGFKVITLKNTPKDVNRTVEQYLTSVKENSHRRIKKYGKKLYKKLFKPLETSIKGRTDIIIVPDGELVKIPFETLIVDDKTSTKPFYLVEKYQIKYVQSASILSILRKHYQRDRTTKHFIGFGDPVYDYDNFKQGKPEHGTPNPVKGDEITEIHRGKYSREGGKLVRLKASGEEINTIAQLFKKHNQKSVVHVREQANEANAKAADLKEFDYIHFSCHGILGDGFQSLVLSQLPPDKSSEDGYFTLNEIMNCDYNAKLVVLSACQTGSGKMYRGEGVMGLTRAVMYAGTPAVVASLWDVDDRATKELMVRFYKNMLEKSMDKVEALRQAKLELLKTQTFSSPYFWSAFIMYGE